ncbi:unnamed protein product [Symbiodinium natans]|uniref:Uncharacterized protein n=1 Tax=Symbiodinium natans TaxID=878477 RepID=A0A812NSV5_9DINO|nr:unnamed protein product [Symbiodinium natans]
MSGELACQLPEPQVLSELSFRNASRSFLYHIEAAGLPIADAKEALHTAFVYIGANLQLVLLADKLGHVCLHQVTHWESFRYVCQQVRGSIRELAWKMRARLELQSRSRHLQEAVENIVHMTTEQLSKLAAAACMHLPQRQADANCLGFVGCHALHRRLAQGSRVLGVLSHVMQSQLETALLWDFSGIPFEDAGTLQLPELPPGISAGDLRSKHDLRVSTLSTLLAQLRAASSPQLRMVEIGVHHGKAAAGLLRRHPSLQYLGVDPYTGHYENSRAQRGSGEFGDTANFRRTSARLRRFGHRARLCRRHSRHVARVGAMRACQVRVRQL